MLILLFSITFSTHLRASGSPSPEAVLRVSLPAGSWFGPDPDPWLNDGWRLYIIGASATFNIRINNTSNAITSYDTHLIIAINNEAYNNLLSLTVQNVTIPKTAFKNGTPKPYNVWTWPSGDVYPTWFNDTYINIGKLPPKSYVDITVSVQFSDPTDARIHFDAYGSKVDPPPPSVPGQITRNPLSGDSTALFSPVPLSPYGPKAYFTETPKQPYAGQTVIFNATLSQPGFNGTHICPIKEYRWNFGDGNTTITTKPIVTHVYNTPNTYTVTLEVYSPGATPETDKTAHLKKVLPRPVGGVWDPINKLKLLLPNLTGAITTLILILTATFIICRLTKRKLNMHKQ